MNPIHDGDIDALLRQAFDGSVPDDGFSDRVMRQLPPRSRPVAWPLLAGVLAGVVLCALSLVASPLWHAGWQGWLIGQWSSSTLILLAVMAAMSLLALGWSLAEADH
jgi:hypothetical protein